MRQILTFLITLLFIITYSNVQCVINEMIVTPTECNVNGDFYVYINFNHSGAPSPQFKVQGNGKNYGTFAYDSLPIQIGPLKADCTTNFEFIVRDFENSNCTAFKNLGKKCCDNNCSITIKYVKVGNCDGSFYSLGFDIDHNASGVGFDVYNNGQLGAKGKMEMDKVPQAGFKIEGLDIAGFNRSALIKNIVLPFKLIKSFLQVRKIVKRFQPDAVIGVGGYSSFPVFENSAGKRNSHFHS